MTTNGYYHAPKASLLRRLLRRLFPAEHLHPTDPLPEWSVGEMFTETIIKLCWRDRLRVLISGKACVQTRTLSSVDPGCVESRGLFYVLPPGQR